MKSSFFLLLLLVFPLGIGAARLDPEAVRQEYKDGDFDALIRVIEDFREKEKTYPKSDSLLIARYLGVVYAANPPTVEKGKYWMRSLLKLDARANLDDLFVSEEIDRIFTKVSREFFSTREAVPPNPGPAPGPDSLRTAASLKPESPEASRPGGVWSSPRTWWAGGLGLAVVGAATVWYVAQGSGSGEEPIPEVIIPKAK